jgi:hypothetical protein
MQAAFLNTRVVGARDNDKYDLVIGACVATEELKRAVAERPSDQLTDRMKKVLVSKSVMAGFRPAIRADLILEFKVLVSGFDPAQRSVHFKHALEDVERLGKLRSTCSHRAAVIFDDCGYLTPSRFDEMIAMRLQEDSSMRFYALQRDSAKQVKWQIR